MADGRIAVLADIHGNSWALDAVLADIDRRGIAEIVDLGDTVQGPLDPAGTADRLIVRAIPGIRGNCDRMLTEPVTEPSPTLDFDLAMRTPKHLAWLRALPPARVLRDEILLCHGTPASDTEYLLEAPSEVGGALRPTAAIAAALAGMGQQVAVCAHSHVPRTVWLPDGKLVVNPGSVGLAAYRNDEPRHIMEAGSPHARYAILERAGSGWTVQHVALVYDWEAAAAAARERGRADWARALLTGRAPAG